jgi:predicted membrane metal-binding protein
MKRKWTYFAGAVILAAYFLLTGGAPPLAILAGIGLAALVTLRPSRPA